MYHYWGIFFLGGGRGLCPSSFRGSYLEVDLEDMRSPNRILDVVGCDGELQLHPPSAKSPLHYSVDSQALIFVENGE